MYVLLIVLLLAYQAQPHSTPKKSSVRTGNAQAKANDKQSDAHPLPAIGECNGCFSIQEPHTQSKQNDSYDARQDALYRWYLGSTVAGVFGGLIGLCFIYRQLKATKNAAEAASKSANALIDSERAWILVELGETQRIIPGDEVGYFWIKPRVKNVGKTIARVKQIRAIVRLNMEDELLPPEPEYTLGQGADIQNINFLIPPEAPTQPIRLLIMGDELAQVNRGERFLYVHGFIIYLDFSGKERRTDFCYYYAAQLGGSTDPAGFFIAITAPPKYNDYT